MAIAGHACACASVGASKARLNQSRHLRCEAFRDRAPYPSSTVRSRARLMWDGGPRLLFAGAVVARCDRARAAAGAAGARRRPVLEAAVSQRPSSRRVQLAALGQADHRARDARAAGAEQQGERAVAEELGQDDAVGRHHAPALGQVAQRAEDAHLDRLGLRRSRAGGRRCGAPGDAGDQRAGQLGHGGRGAGEARVEDRDRVSDDRAPEGARTAGRAGSWRGRRRSPAPSSSPDVRWAAVTQRISAPLEDRKPRPPSASGASSVRRPSGRGGQQRARPQPPARGFEAVRGTAGRAARGGSP